MFRSDFCSCFSVFLRESSETGTSHLEVPNLAPPATILCVRVHFITLLIFWPPVFLLPWRAEGTVSPRRGLGHKHRQWSCRPFWDGKQWAGSCRWSYEVEGMGGPTPSAEGPQGTTGCLTSGQGHLLQLWGSYQENIGQLPEGRRRTWILPKNLFVPLPWTALRSWAGKH